MANIKETVNLQFIATVLTIIGIAVAAALWATNCHANLKDWATSQDYVTRAELKEVMKEQYVPMPEFVKVRTQLEQLIEQNRDISKSFDKIERKLDAIAKKR